MNSLAVPIGPFSLQPFFWLALVVLEKLINYLGFTVSYSVAYAGVGGDSAALRNRAPIERD